VALTKCYEFANFFLEILTWHVVHMAEAKMQRLFVEKYKVKIFLERSICTLEYNNKLDLK
jgi:hypothetical protein